MSSNTENLGLYKVDPSTDGDNTFNIEKILNENWDKIDEKSKKVDEKLTTAGFTWGELKGTT